MEKTALEHQENRLPTDEDLKAITDSLLESKDEVGSDFEDAKRAIEFIVRTQDARTESLMKYMHMGFNRAARLMDIVEEAGVVAYTPKRAVLVKPSTSPFVTAPKDEFQLLYEATLREVEAKQAETDRLQTVPPVDEKPNVFGAMFASALGLALAFLLLAAWIALLLAPPFGTAAAIIILVVVVGLSR